MARKRKHVYKDMTLNPKQIALLSDGHVVHKQLRGSKNRVAVRIRHPLDKKINYHMQMVSKLTKERKGSSG